MPFKRDLGLQNIPLSKQPFQMQPQIENEDITGSPQCNIPAIRNQQAYGIVTSRSGVRWLILVSSYYTQNMYHIINAQV